MARMSSKMLRFFKRCGQRGGKLRKERLTPSRRSIIATCAAYARWKKPAIDSSSHTSVRLVKADWNDPSYIEEILSDGTLKDWRELYLRIADQPFGTTVKALENVLGSLEIYGIISLWKQILGNVQGIQL
jgi:hypothetical protein